MTMFDWKAELPNALTSSRYRATFRSRTRIGSGASASEAQAAANQCQGQCQGLGQGLNMQQAMQQWCQKNGNNMGNWGHASGGKAQYAKTPTGTKISNRQMKSLPLTGEDWHPEWNYRLDPTPP